jgi:tRNA dimethylallyltransferase
VPCALRLLHIDTQALIWYSPAMKDLRPKLIIIAGPTASGKTGLAVKLAHEFNGEIVNADSMQVYRYMDIGTAKPTMDQREWIPHHLIDVVDPDEEFNASVYRRLAVPAINSVIERSKTCFVAGGTGLYIKALLGGLMECPSSDPELKDALISECMEKGSPFLHDRLNKLDPESAARIHPNDKARVIRALEIISLSDRPPSSIMNQHAFNDKMFRTLKICLDVGRDELYDRINRRCDHMIESGLVEETEALFEKGFSSQLRSMKSLGYRHAVSLLNKDWSTEEMIYNLKLDTRRYAKRQLTWFRGDAEMVWLEPGNMEAIRSRIGKFNEEP